MFSLFDIMCYLLWEMIYHDNNFFFLTYNLNLQNKKITDPQ